MLVMYAMLAIALAGLALIITVPAYFMAIGLRRWLGARARAGAWIVAAAAFAGSAFWIAVATLSSGSGPAGPVWSSSQELALAHLAGGLAMTGLLLWPRGPLR